MSTSQRIHIVGTAGSGKTTLGRELSARLGIPHIELDRLFWEENWRKSDLKVFKTRVREALSGESWVVEGNYSLAREIVWERVELVVWLDFSLWICLWRVLTRSVRRILSREELWHGNRETIRGSFFSSDSLLWYVIKTTRRRRRQYEELSSLPENAHIQFVRLRKPSDLAEFLASFTV